MLPALSPSAVDGERFRERIDVKHLERVTLRPSLDRLDVAKAQIVQETLQQLVLL